MLLPDAVFIRGVARCILVNTNETTGASEGKITGLFELDGAWYYAIKGAAKSGWWNLTDADGESGYYYFSPADFKAVDENQTIDGYKYVFENCKLVRGDFVKDSGGTHYRWAGEWLCNNRSLCPE